MEANIALNRFGLGGRPGEAVPEDPKRWLFDQLGRYEPRPAAIAAAPTTATVAQGLADYFQQLRQGRMQLRQAGGQNAAMQAEPSATMQPAAMPGQRQRNPAMRSLRMEAARETRADGRGHYIDAVGARMEATMRTPAPFIERLVHFWANHFAVSADKLTVVGLAGTMEFDAIRPHVLGKFADMLMAVERHPAMLLYLDQAQSVGPNSPLGQQVAGRGRRQVGLNENLAREIMELHTMGVGSGYAQGDVTEFARAMTGWTVVGIGNGQAARIAGTRGAPGEFVFAPRLHEPGARTILGKSYAQQGVAQANAVLADLATHPATAKHIATKLARHFAGDAPPAPLVAKLERAFLSSGGDLPTVYRALIDAPEAWAAGAPKFKTPWEWSVSTMRALGAQSVDGQAMTGLLNQLGQPVWRPGSPAGYDDIAASWAGPDALMRRVEAAERIASQIRGDVDPRARAAQLFPAALSDATAQAIARAESPAQGLALMLVSPEMLRR